jgi:hypothetical protein
MFLEGLGENNNVVQVWYTNLVSKVSQTVLQNLWKLVGAFISPNGILVHSYKPQGVIKAVKG